MACRCEFVLSETRFTPTLIEWQHDAPFGVCHAPRARMPWYVALLPSHILEANGHEMLVAICIVVPEEMLHIRTEINQSTNQGNMGNPLRNKTQTRHGQLCRDPAHV